MVGRHAGRQMNLAVAFNRRQHDHGRLHLVAQLVDGFAQGLGVGAAQGGGKHFHTLHINGLAQQLIALR